MGPRRFIRAAIFALKAAWSLNSRGLTAGLFLLALAAFGAAPARADCTISEGANRTFTYTYTAANYGQTADLFLKATVVCTHVPSLYTVPYRWSDWTSGFVFDPNGDALGIVLAPAGLQHCTTSPVSDTHNGTTGTQVWNDDIQLPGWRPAGSTNITPPGTYSQTNVKFTYGYEPSIFCGGTFDSSNSVESNYTIQYIIPPVCTIVSTTTVDFGNIPTGTRLGANRTAQGGVSVACANGTPYTIYLGGGKNRLPNGGNRQMTNGSSFLPYQLYKTPVPSSSIWDDTGLPGANGKGGVSKVGTGNTDLTTVYAAIPSGTTTPTTAGSYSDMIMVTVVY